MKVGTRALNDSNLGSQATHAATRRLRETHSEEYAEFLAEERVARGLPTEPQRDALLALRDRVAQLEAELLDKVGPARQ